MKVVFYYNALIFTLKKLIKAPGKSKWSAMFLINRDDSEFLHLVESLEIRQKRAGCAGTGEPIRRL
jgi:hypothetical protein